MNLRALILSLLIALTVTTLRTGAHPQGKRRITESETGAVIQAIQDEIYSLNLQKNFFDVGPSPKGHPGQVIVNVYFQPEILENSRSWLIYKLMPDGEIYRMYELGRSGRIYLHGKPGAFRITQPDYPTVFMDDDDLCKLKHDWIKRQFVVDTEPGLELVKAARDRQREREQSAH